MIIIWVAVDGSDPVRSNILYTASVLARSRNPSSPSLSKLRRRIFHIFPHVAIPFPFSFSRKSLLFVAVPSLISEKLAPMSIKRQKNGKHKKERVSAPLSPPPFFFSLSHSEAWLAHETHLQCHRYAGTRQIDNNTQGVYGIPSTRPPRQLRRRRPSFPPSYLPTRRRVALAERGEG